MRKKTRMRDLNEGSDVDLQELLRKRREKERKNVRIAQAEAKRFSMFATPKRAVIFLLGSVILFCVIVHGINLILESAGFPSAIPL